MITTIFFDLGKVLADFDWEETSHKIAKDSHRAPEFIYEICTNSPIALDYEAGRIITPVFFDRLKTEIGFTLSTGELKHLWSDIFTPNIRNISILDTVRMTYPIGLISNTNEAHVEWISKKFHFLEWFSNPTYSYVTGYLKPQKEIFLQALRANTVSPEESLFIDDLEQNALAAKKLGMSAIHLTPDKDLAEELKQFDLNGI